MSEAGVGAVGRFVRAGRESLCLVRAKGSALVLETLFLAEDVNSQAEIDEAIAETEVKKTELALAQQLIDGLSGSFDPKELTSNYRRDLRVLLEAKLRGEEITVPEPEAEPAPMVDLLEALKASVAAAKTKDGADEEPAREAPGQAERRRRAANGSGSRPRRKALGATPRAAGAARGKVGSGSVGR